MKRIIITIGIVLMMGCDLVEDINLTEERFIDNELLGNWKSGEGVIVLFDEKYITISYDFKETVYNYGYYICDNKIIVLNNKMFVTTYCIVDNILHVKDITFTKI